VVVNVTVPAFGDSGGPGLWDAHYGTVKTNAVVEGVEGRLLLPGVEMPCVWNALECVLPAIGEAHAGPGD
jgi:hypothetical protein